MSRIYVIPYLSIYLEKNTENMGKIHKKYEMRRKPGRLSKFTNPTCFGLKTHIKLWSRPSILNMSKLLGLSFCMWSETRLCKPRFSLFCDTEAVEYQPELSKYFQ